VLSALQSPSRGTSTTRPRPARRRTAGDLLEVLGFKSQEPSTSQQPCTGRAKPLFPIPMRTQGVRVWQFCLARHPRCNEVGSAAESSSSTAPNATRGFPLRDAPCLPVHGVATTGLRRVSTQNPAKPRSPGTSTPGLHASAAKRDLRPASGRRHFGRRSCCLHRTRELQELQDLGRAVT